MEDSGYTSDELRSLSMKRQSQIKDVPPHDRHEKHPKTNQNCFTVVFHWKSTLPELITDPHWLSNRFKEINLSGNKG